jgi:hypothetical protein
VVGEEWNPKILLNLPFTSVPRCFGYNAKTSGLSDLQFMDMAAGSGPPDRALVVHHGADELLVQQHTVCGGQTASPVKEWAKYAQSLDCLLSHLADMCRPGQPRIKGHPKITSCFNPLYRLSEKLHWSGFLDAPLDLTNSAEVFFEKLMAILQSRSQSSSLTVGLQVTDEKR